MELAVEASMTSPDGATIAYQTAGCGPHVIVIPGVLSMAANYEALGNALAEGFTVHTIERRGRGRSSSQGHDYCIATECMDVAALQEKTQSSYLFGHSYGGLIALETARNNLLFRKVAVYEPGVSVDGSMPITWSAAYERLLAQNKRLDAFVEFSAAVGPARARNTPRWLMKLLLPVIMKREDLRLKLELLETNLREHREIANLNNTYQNYAEVSAHTLLVCGGKSDLPWVAPAIKKLSAVLPSTQSKQFPRLNHFGPDQTGPREVAQVVRDYFAG